MRGYVIPLVVICLLLTIFTACSQSNETANYLDQTYDIVVDSTDISAELAILFVKIQQGSIDNTSVIAQLNSFETSYQELLTEFQKVYPPQECMKFKGYFVEYLTSTRASIQYMQDYFRFGSESDLNSAISNGSNADSMIVLASNEWDRRQRESNEDNDFKWWYIPLGLMALAFAVYAGGCLLSLVFSIPMLSIGMIITGISSLFRKIRGDR